MPDDNVTARFLTYRYYLRALAGLAGFAHPATEIESVYAPLAERIRVMPSCRRHGTRPHDEQALRRSLTNAWGTELLLSLGGEYSVEDELLRVTNNWAAVQLYYVFYHATQALVIARGNERPDSHPTTQKLFVDMWATRAMDCMPWTLGYGVSPRNAPNGHQLKTTITTVARPRSEEDFINYTLKALFTTRNEAIPLAMRSRREAKKRQLKLAWESSERERLSQGKRARQQPRFALPTLVDEEKAAARDGVRCYTVMDLLWRLRTRTNYRDGLMFIEGPMDETVSAELNMDMRNLSSCTMLLYELHICQEIGVDAMRTIADGWLDRNRVSSHKGLGQRLTLVLGA